MFKMYVNNLPTCVKSCKIWLFADDGKFVSGASREDQCQLTQSDLDAVHSWSLANQIPLSLPKCQSLHLDRKNINHVYSLSAAAVSVVNQCTDLGLLRTSDFLYTEHIRSIVDKALRCSGMLFRSFSSRQRAFMLKLFVTYMRPIVEYASSVWNSTQVSFRREVEYVQRRFTRRIRNLKHFSYEKRCKRLHLVTLEHRRNQADLIVAFKVLHGELDIDAGSIGVAWS